MTPHKVLEVLKKYEALLREYGYFAERCDAFESEASAESMGRHALWMCGEATRFLLESTEPQEGPGKPPRTEKAMRWLGFIQGCLFCLGERTIDEMKQDNMPDPTDGKAA